MSYNPNFLPPPRLRVAEHLSGWGGNHFAPWGVGAAPQWASGVGGVPGWFVWKDGKWTVYYSDAPCMEYLLTFGPFLGKCIIRYILHTWSIWVMKKPGSLRFPIWFPIDITSYLSSYLYIDFFLVNILGLCFFLGGVANEMKQWVVSCDMLMVIEPSVAWVPQVVCHFLQLSNRDRHFEFRPCDGWKIGGNESQYLWQFDFISFFKCFTMLNDIYEYLCNFLYGSYILGHRDEHQPLPKNPRKARQEPAIPKRSSPLASDAGAVCGPGFVTPIK